MFFLDEEPWANSPQLNVQRNVTKNIAFIFKFFSIEKPLLQVLQTKENLTIANSYNRA